MNMVLSIILAVVVAGAAIAANNLSENEGDHTVRVAGAIGLAISVGAINIFSVYPKIVNALWLEPIFLVVMLGFSVGLLVWWYNDGRTAWQMLCFGIMMILFLFPTKAAAKMTTILITNSFLASLVDAIPWIMLVVSVGFVLTDWLRFRAVQEEDDETTD